MKIKLVLIVSLFLCILDSSTKAVSQVFTVDITKEYPKKEFCLQEVAQVEYIPLETRKDALLDANACTRFCISDSLMVTYNSAEGTVFIFNRKGKVVNLFNHIGKSGEEYQAISRMSVDFAKQEIFIYDFVQKCRIIVYDYKGDFKRVLKVPEQIWIGVMFDFDSNYLICYDEYGLSRGKDYHTKPYFLLDKKDGKIVPLDFFLKNRMNTALSLKENKISAIYSESEVIGIDAYPMIKNGEKVYMADWACDTIFGWKGRVLRPRLVKIPSGIQHNPPLLCWVNLKTNRYTFLTSIEKVLNASMLKSGKAPSKDIVWDHVTNRCYKPEFVNKDYTTTRNYCILNMGMELPENYACCYFPAYYMVEDERTGKLSGKLKEVALTLQEDDNPVLMLVKFKQ